VLENSNNILQVPWQAGDTQKEVSSNAEARAGNNQPAPSRANWPHISHITLWQTHL